MQSTRRHWPTWLAIFAVLWTSLSATLAQAWVEGGDRVAVCTSTGVAWVQIDDSGAAADETSQAAARNTGCVWCLSGVGAWDLPPAHRSFIPSTSGGVHWAAVAVRPAIDAGRWWHPQLRAPPTAHVSHV